MAEDRGDREIEQGAHCREQGRRSHDITWSTHVVIMSSKRNMAAVTGHGTRCSGSRTGKTRASATGQTMATRAGIVLRVIESSLLPSDSFAQLALLHLLLLARPLSFFPSKTRRLPLSSSSSASSRFALARENFTKSLRLPLDVPRISTRCQEGIEESWIPGGTTFLFRRCLAVGTIWIFLRFVRRCRDGTWSVGEIGKIREFE